jgi:TetR/AcrR family transcriptional regulator, regulator of biofilm formation and stress response
MGSDGAEAVSRPAHRQGRQALIDAAIAIASRRGLRGLTYRAVAKAAGVSYGLVGHHFGSRAALIREALGSSVETLERATLERPGRLEDFAAELAGFIAENEDLLVFQYELTMEARRRPELAGDIEKMYTDVLAIVARRLQEFGVEDPDDSLGWLIVAAIDGMILQQLVFSDPGRTRGGIGIVQGLVTARQKKS